MDIMRCYTCTCLKFNCPLFLCMLFKLLPLREPLSSPFVPSWELFRFSKEGSQEGLAHIRCSWNEGFHSVYSTLSLSAGHHEGVMRLWTVLRTRQFKSISCYLWFILHALQWVWENQFNLPYFAKVLLGFSSTLLCPPPWTELKSFSVHP